MSIFGGNMDDLLPKLLVFPPHPPPAIPLSDAQYEDGIKSQINYVSRLSDKQLMAQTSGGEGPLDVSSVQLWISWFKKVLTSAQVINPALNTVPYVFILLAHLQAANKGHKGLSWEDLFEKMVNFAETFDSRQIRYLGKEFSAIIDHLSSIARSSRQVWFSLAFPNLFPRIQVAVSESSHYIPFGFLQSTIRNSDCHKKNKTCANS